MVHGENLFHGSPWRQLSPYMEQGEEWVSDFVPGNSLHMGLIAPL